MFTIGGSMTITDLAREAAEAGATTAVDLFRTDLPVERKAGKTDYVTRADRRTQQRIVSTIRESDPEGMIVGEENDARTDVPQKGRAWVIDPIDGTNNYVRGMRHWATSVAVVEDGEPIAAANVLPAVGDTYVAERDGVRRNGESVSVSGRTDLETFTVAPTVWWDFDRRDEYAAAAEGIVTRFGDLVRLKSVQVALALVAAGSIEGAITNVRPNPWDSIAGVHLVERAGGRVTDIDGEDWHHDSHGLVASNGRDHGAMLAVAREADRLRERKGT
ncbi:Archaeal fructose-1,6-bisphosphatase or related enzyme of inositol monophosphatase family [Halapricum desulfuricans]|uniref:fructose-bisphosphatase n=2 Tax=Halapricum desulfuricans TaxID=2841257 RepID=A0A897NFQ1_9EURY|nr:Archaeal fructose-1,6-bisphosphatase or related enzyme of inositol monophosphatase family [Halapricum desulfuricans]